MQINICKQSFKFNKINTCRNYFNSIQMAWQCSMWNSLLLAFIQSNFTIQRIWLDGFQVVFIWYAFKSKNLKHFQLLFSLYHIKACVYSMSSFLYCTCVVLTLNHMDFHLQITVNQQINPSRMMVTLKWIRTLSTNFVVNVDCDSPVSSNLHLNNLLI